MTTIIIPSASTPSSSSVSPLFPELQRRVGRYLGYQSNPDAFDANQELDVNDAIQMGLRRFYFCGHDWSFLRKDFTVTLSGGITWYSLESDFVRLLGRTTTSSRMLEPIPEEDLRAKTAIEAVTTGGPRFYTVRFVDTSTSNYEIGFYPITADVVVSGWYLFAPPELTDSVSVPQGALNHYETIVLACLAAAEEMMNPEVIAQGGIYRAAFAERLAKSIEEDNRLLNGEAK